MSRLNPPEVLRVTRETLAGTVAEHFARGFRLALVAAHEDGSGGSGAILRIVYVLLGTAGERTEVVVEVPRSDAWLPTLARWAMRTYFSPVSSIKEIRRRS